MPDVYKAPTKTQAHSHEHKHPAKNPWTVVVDEVLESTGEKARSEKGGSYCVRPPYRFATQQEDEEIVLLLRAHPITNAGWILLVLFMLMVPGIISASGVLGELPRGFLFVGHLTWYLVTLAYAFERFLFWYYSIFIVTNERLVDFDFVNLMYRKVTYSNLDNVQETVKFTGGFVRSMLQYGNVYVTTASERPTMEAQGVPYPEKVVDIITRLSEELRKRRERGE